VVFPKSIPMDLICMTDPPSGFSNLIINQVGWLGGGPSHYRDFTHLTRPGG
jgi:hypothetical protein